MGLIFIVIFLILIVSFSWLCAVSVVDGVKYGSKVFLWPMFLSVIMIAVCVFFITNTAKFTTQKDKLHKEKFQIIETTEGKFIPYENNAVLGRQCIGPDGFTWTLKYEDAYCLYDDEEDARKAIQTSIIRYHTVHISTHTPQRVIGAE